MAELVDAHDSKSCGAIHGSSILPPGTTLKTTPKIIVILGPTASGKSGLAIRLAKEINGEVISADSRQVYKGMNVGSGKVTSREIKGVPHHLLDVTSPKKVFTVAQFQKLGQEKINEIVERGNVPIICGGTGFYIQALVDSVTLPDVPPNPKLRKILEKKTTEQLAEILKKIDSRRYSKIDTNNRVRLMRAIEIAKTLGKVPKVTKKTLYNPLFIGINPDQETLKKNISRRLHARFKQGMIKEVEGLHSSGVSWKRLENFGLEYRNIALFLQKKLSKTDMVERLETEINQYAKRQMTWFKKDKRINWFEPTEWNEIKKLVQKFL